MSLTFPPGTPLFWVNSQFTDDSGDPLSLGSLKTYIAGTDTPLATYSDATLLTPNPTTIELGADGRPSVAVFIAATGYRLRVFDADDVETSYSPIENFSNPAAVAIFNLGAYLYQGSKNVADGYLILATADGYDNTITVDGSGGPNPCKVYLPAASDYTTGPLSIINVGTVPVKIFANGADTIQGVATFTLPASGGAGLYPSATFLSDAVSAWLAITQSLVLS